MSLFILRHFNKEVVHVSSALITYFNTRDSPFFYVIYQSGDPFIHPFILSTILFQHFQ